MLKGFLLATVLTASVSGIAAAAPITGSFTLGSFGGAYVSTTSPTPTTINATGLDFGSAYGGGGNGYGINGTAIVNNASGSFSTLIGVFADISDISLGATQRRLGWCARASANP